MKRTIKRNATADEILLSEAFDNFIEAKEAQNLSASTMRNYNQSWGFFIEYCFPEEEEVFCSMINENLIFKWINHMRKEEISNSSINHYVRDVRAVLYWMMERDYIEDKFKIKCIETQEEAPKFFDDEALEILLEKPRRNDTFATWRTYTIISFILATGARPSTVVSLKVSDINFNRKEITYGHMKTKQAMIVPLSAGLESVLKEYIRMWRSDDMNGWLFCNVGEEQLTVNALRLSFTKYCKDRGLEQTNIYGLRHSFARGWIRNNGNTFALQKVLGHSDISMTKRYVKLYSEDLKQGYEDFSVLDNVKKSKSRKSKVKRND